MATIWTIWVCEKINCPGFRAIFDLRKRRAAQIGLFSPKGYRKNILTNPDVCAILLKHLDVRGKYRGVEQLEARRAHNPEVVGSSPASATKKTAVFTMKTVVFLTF